VRRFPAILLAAIFAFSAIGPALVVNRTMSVPACCRRDGKHHCARTDAPSAGPEAVPPRCAEFPNAGAFPLHTGKALPPGSQLVFGALVQYPPVVAEAADGYRVSFSRSRQERGPPSLFS